MHYYIMEGGGMIILPEILEKMPERCYNYNQRETIREMEDAHI
jgi:hypothetical protein